VFPRSVSRIFVVDDEPVIASSLAAILRMNGFSAKFFTCPLEALAAARFESPDLVIADVAMPGIFRGGFGNPDESAISQLQDPALFRSSYDLGFTGACSRSGL
jgi:CheY-like chemotaxis protein